MSRKHSKHKRERTESPAKKTRSQQHRHDKEKMKTEQLSHCSGGSQLSQQSSLSPGGKKKRKLYHQEVDAATALKLSMEEQANSSWPRLSNSKDKQKASLAECKSAPVEETASLGATSSSLYSEKIKCKSKRKKKHKKRSHEGIGGEKHQSSTTMKQAYESRHIPSELPWCEKCRSSEFCKHVLKCKAMPSTAEADLQMLKAKASESSFRCMQADFKDHFSKRYVQNAGGEYFVKNKNEYSSIKFAHGTSVLAVPYVEKEIENKEQITSSLQLHKESKYSDIMQNCKDSGKDPRNLAELDGSKEKSINFLELLEKPHTSGKPFDVWNVTNAPLKAVKNAANTCDGSKILESVIWEKCNKISNCLRGLRKKSKQLKQFGNEFNIERAPSQLSKNSGKSSDYPESSGIEKQTDTVSQEPTTSLSLGKKYGPSLRPGDDSQSTELAHKSKGVSGYPHNYHLKIMDSNSPLQSQPFERSDVSTLSSRSSESTEEFETPKQAKKFHSFKILKKVSATDALSQTISKKLLSSSAAQLKCNSSDDATKSTSIQQDHELFKHQPDSQRVCASTTLPDHVDMDTDQKMEIVEELQTARHEKVLEVELGQSYGELTSMDIDPPQEIKIFSSEATSQTDILLVLDTNIFISHLNFIMNVKDHGVLGVGFPIIVIPWVVLQELDSLKNGKLSRGVNRKAIPAVQFIYSCFKIRHPRVWGQSMQQAAQKFCSLRDENNDDRVLQCCLQYQQLYPGTQVLLCSDDKNLCSKALVSGVKAVREIDLLTELSDLKSTSDIPNTQDLSGFNRPQSVIHVKEPNGANNPHLSGQMPTLDVTGIICQLEKSLGSALSVILETEMKSVYEDLWTEILFVKPPWSLEDVLQCVKKHWFAVFGLIVKRNLQSSVETLCDHFRVAKRPSYNQFTLTWMLLESQKLLQAFCSRSDYGGVLPHTLAVMDELLNKVSEDGSKNELQSKSSVKSEESTEKLEVSVEQPVNPDSGRNLTLVPFNCPSGYPMSQVENSQGVSRSQQIWATFENVWNIINKYSSLIFATFNLPHNSVAVVNDSKLPLPEEAFQSLQRLMPAVKELLAGIQRILSSDSNVQDFQKLTETLHIFLNNEETNISVTRFSVQDLHECFTHEEYRKRLMVGYSQLAELTYRLEQCNAAVCLEARNRGLV
ncbi:transcriptional protein SWT1 isoform X1 [Scyliorhinus canicula]|uniref:transcriptional protein SWT1 isoform X1 n=2 Tax=Scyliorhinus canicula TaxID=7830 RepID=UPI0018F39E61|nr:transcriptional protein SWT1 isoform X1 [Scyliorhinus canicula]